MKKLYKLFLAAGVIFIQLAFNGCDPFDDAYLTLAMDTEFNTVGIGTDIFLSNSICLSDFEDYDDNKDKV